jgi:hypothetical protein
MFSANAGELTVSGSAKATYNIVNGAQADNGIGVTNELAFKASGEMDNGYTWSYTMELDPSTTGSTASTVPTTESAAGAAINDDTALTLTMNDLGTVKVCVSECGNNKKYAWDASAYTSMSDTGYSEGIKYPSDAGSTASIQYHTPELPFGTTASVAYGQTKKDGQSGNSTGGGSGDSMSEYSLVTKPVDGLTASASYYQKNDYDDGVTSEQQLEEGGAYALKYSAGNVTVGYGKSFKAPESTDLTTTTVEYYENRGVSIAMAVNDALSVSYTDEVSESNAQHSPTVTYDVELQSVQAAYSLGGATLSLARASYDNVSYVNGDDQTETIIAMTFAF